MFRSSDTSSENDTNKTKRHLKQNKPEILTKISRESYGLSTSHRECDRGECIGGKKKRSGKRKRKYSHSESSSSFASESEQDRKMSKKHKKKERKQRKEKKRKKNKRKKERQRTEKVDESCVETADTVPGPMPPVQMPQNQAPADEMQFKRRAMVPMTKEEYERQQSKVRRVFDPETGRNRLVKGDGEIIEEVVSYHRHKEINKLATLGDGTSFQKSLGLHK